MGDNPGMPFALLFVVIAYLLGSVSGSLMLGRLRGVDIRQSGSGNAGGTNALRTQGFRFALATVLIDVGKGALAVWLPSYFMTAHASLLLLYSCALAAAAGHVWPLFHGFRGGKGAATLVGGIAVLWPQALLPAVIVWLLNLMITGYVGLSTILAGITLFLFALVGGVDDIRLGFSLVVALFLVFTHRSNLAHLRAGQEPRAERMRVLGRLFSRTRQ